MHRNKNLPERYTGLVYASYDYPGPVAEGPPVHSGFLHIPVIIPVKIPDKRIRDRLNNHYTSPVYFLYKEPLPV